MNRNKGKITLSLAIAATLTITSATAFADMNTENTSAQVGQTTPTQEQSKADTVTNIPLQMQVMGGETTTSPAINIVPVSSIEIDTNSPLKKDYIKGTPLTTTGSQLIINWENGKHTNTPLTPDMITGYNSDQLGEQTLTVTYENKTTTFKVLVDKAIDFSVQKYHVFEASDFNVLGKQVITVTYHSGLTKEVELTKNDFLDLDTMDIAGLLPCYLNYDGLCVFVYISVPLPNKEILSIEQLSLPWVFNGTNPQNPNIAANYKVTFKDNTSCVTSMSGMGDITYTYLPLESQGLARFVADTTKLGTVSGLMLVTSDGSNYGFPKLSLTTRNVNKKYKVNDRFDLEGPVDIYEGLKYICSVSAQMHLFDIVNFNTSTPGEYTATISLNGMFKTPFKYTVVDSSGSSGKPVNPGSNEDGVINIDKFTDSYKVGDKFDGKGLVIFVNNMGKRKDIYLPSNDVQVTGFDTSTAGEKTVTVTYAGKTATYRITVNPATNGGGTSGGGSSSGGGSATTPAKPSETKPATPTQADTKPAIKDAAQVGQGETKLTKFNKITAENIKQVNGFFVPANNVAEGTPLPSDIKAVVVEGKKPAFKDVAKHWAASSINEAVERGLLNGMSETSFQPKAPLTAEQTFAGLSNVLIKNNILNVKIDKDIIKEKLSSQFSNPTWSTLSVAQVLANTNPGLVDKYSEPQSLKETMTRGEMANVIYHLGHDVFPNNAKNAEEFCKELGIMVGDKNGNFASERVLSRAELSSILLRIDDKLAQL